MNKSRYIPFERNRYFYGKLLTVRDFMTEQTYYTDKRRLTNRLLHGSGVLMGLQVVAIDEKSVTVETGVALDQLGREIVVPSPVTMKLSMLDGFTNNEYAKNVYLCIAYDEQGREPVHSVAGVSGRDEEVSEHNRILESYRLYVREDAPAPAVQEYSHLIEETSIWYEDAQIRVLQTIPRFLEPGQIFELKLTIEKTLQTPHIEFEYVPDWTNIEPVEALPEGKIKFSEPIDGSRTSYSKSLALRALPSPNGESRYLGSIAAKKGSVRLSTAEKTYDRARTVTQQIEIAEEPAAARMLKAFYERSLDRALESPSAPGVCLAKINLMQMGATYAIDSIEPLPLEDYILNATVLYRILSAQQRLQSEKIERIAEAATKIEAAPAFPDIAEEFAMPEEAGDADKQTRLVASGLTEISIIPPKKKRWYHRRQRNFFSEEITHGLGEGPMLITTGLSDEQEALDVPVMWERKDSVYYGQQEIFKESLHASELPRTSIGVVCYPKKGTFRIGIRVHEWTERTRLRVRWWAVKTQDDASAVQSYAELEVSEQEAAAAKN